MFNEKKLVKLFKDFFDKTILPCIRQNNSVFKEWLYFSSMLSQQYIDYLKIEKYVQELNSTRKNILLQKSNNVHSHSLSYNKGFTIESFFKPEDDYLKLQKSPVSSSFDYGKQYPMNSFKSDNEIIKPTEHQIKSKPIKKPLSKLVANLSNLYELFSDNQRAFQKRNAQSPLISHNYSNKIII